MDSVMDSGSELTMMDSRVDSGMHFRWDLLFRIFCKELWGGFVDSGMDSGSDLMMMDSGEDSGIKNIDFPLAGPGHRHR